MRAVTLGTSMLRPASGWVKRYHCESARLMLTRCTTVCYIALMDKTITFRIPPALLAKVEKLAKADERSVSFVLRKAVEEYVEQHKGGKQ
jgi:hypothetical protein